MRTPVVHGSRTTDAFAARRASGMAHGVGVSAFRGAETPAGRLIVVSNRLPVTVRWQGMEPVLVPSSGGLATGLRGVHERGGTRWVGWAGVAAGPTAEADRLVARRLAARDAVGVPLSAAEITGFYDRYANGVLWPVLHDRTDVAPPAPADLEHYRAVNERFADVIARELRPGDRVWIHDYHLMLLPRLLRERCPGARIGFFLHTPFPAPATLAAVPEHAALLDGLLGADVVGLHTGAYVARFLAAATTLLGRSGTSREVADGARRVRVHASAMSIDVAAFEARAGAADVAARVAALRAPAGPLFVGVDRLDYTKGIPERLRAFARLLERRPELRGHARLLQLAVPSREEVPAYQALRAEVRGLVGQINRRFGDGGWTPVEYVYGSVDAIDLAALYRSADVMLVTPLRDGMNLVAKEFVASRTDLDGVLVLSEQAGAAGELRAALLVDPTDVDGLATAYETALDLSPTERRVRMRRLRQVVRRHDVHQWARECLLSLGGAGPADAGRPVAVGWSAG